MKVFGEVSSGAGWTGGGAVATGGGAVATGNGDSCGAQAAIARTKHSRNGRFILFLRELSGANYGKRADCASGKALLIGASRLYPSEAVAALNRRSSLPFQIRSRLASIR
jgi:hypothetical protein